MTFYLGYANHLIRSLGTETLDATGKATLTTSTLPAGSDDLYAVYNGDPNFPSSTSPVIIQVVLAKPGHCDDHYDNWFYGSPGRQYPRDSGNNFFWVPTGSFQVHGSNGNNCFWGGDGDDSYSGGNGHDDITCGNGNNGISSEMAMMTSRSATERTRSLLETAMTRWPSATEPQPGHRGQRQ